MARERRYTLQRKAQALLFDPAKPADQQARVCWCNRTIRTRGERLGVYRADEGQGARLSGLSTCGSVWACPVCAAKITEARRRELDLALTAWIKAQGVVNLMTLTYPHQRFDADGKLVDLGGQLDLFAKALQRFKSCKGYKRIMADAGRAGSIRSLEATHGANGWHPHTHDLVFLTRELTHVEIDQLKSDWARIVIKVGLAEECQRSDILAHGFDVQDGRYAAEYIAKWGHDSAWGAAAEMTRPHAKLGTVGDVAGEAHYTPFQLLARAEAGDTEAAPLFRTFAAAFQGRRMLSWSPKLRLLLTGKERELSDEELAAHDDPLPGESRIAELHEDQFAALIARNKLGEFLTYVARCCWRPESAQEDVDDYIASIEGIAPTHSGRYRRKRFIGSGFVEIDQRGQ